MTAESSPASPPSGQPVPPWLLAAALALLAVLPFSPCLTAGFVWDDASLFRDAWLRRGSALFDIWLRPHALPNREGHYWPMTYTALFFQHLLWGAGAMGYHAVSLLLHGANTVLAWLVLSRLGMRGAWFAAAIFAVHPVHVESVAWVIEQKGLLAAGFALGASLVYLDYLASPRRGFGVLAVALFAAAMLCKSSVAPLPVVLLLVAWWMRGRVGIREAAPLAAMLAAGALLLLIDAAVQRAVAPPDFALPWPERIAAAGGAVRYYLMRAVWPVPAPPLPPKWPLDAVAVGALWLAAPLLAAGLLAVAGRAAGRAVALAIAAWYLLLLPILGLVPHGFMRYALAADRYQYLAILPLAAGLTAAAMRLLADRDGAARRGALAGGAALISAGAALSLVATPAWTSNESWARATLRGNPDSPMARQLLAVTLLQQSNSAEALPLLEALVSEDPSNIPNAYNLAVAHHMADELDKSLTAIESIQAAEPGHLNSLALKARILQARGETTAALELAEQVLGRSPGHPTAARVAAEISGGK